MIIDNLPNTYFYDGYEGEPEIIFYLDGEKEPSLHVWEGYFEDILKEPDLSGHGWKGFTRDYHEGKNVFSDNDTPVLINIEEYSNDLKQYTTKDFDFDETLDCLLLLCQFLDEAKDMNHFVTVEVS